MKINRCMAVQYFVVKIRSMKTNKGLPKKSTYIHLKITKFYCMSSIIALRYYV